MVVTLELSSDMTATTQQVFVDCDTLRIKANINIIAKKEICVRYNQRLIIDKGVSSPTLICDGNVEFQKYDKNTDYYGLVKNYNKK